MKHFRWADFCVVRSALLPIEHELAESGTSLAEAANDLLADDLVRRAVRTASPSILAAHEDPKRASPSAHAALIRYVERMRGRATPFALLAGYSVVRADAPAARGVRLSPAEKYRHRVRLDLDAVCTIVRDDARARLMDVRWQVKRDVVRFPDVVRVVKRSLDESLAYDDVARTPALDAILSHAREPRTVAELASCIPGRHADAVKVDFVRRMIGAEILVPEHFPALLTADERRSLAQVRAAAELVEASTAVRDTALGDPIDEKLARVEGALAEMLPAGSGSRLIHDLIKPVEGSGLTLAGAESELRKVALLLSSVAELTRDPGLDDFRRHFVERYEGRTVRLVDALDEDRGYDFPASSPPAPDPRAKAWAAVRGRWRHRALDPEVRSVELTDEDVALIAHASSSLPPSGALSCSLALDDGGRLEIWDPTLLGAPGSLLFARGTGADAELHEHTRRWLSEAAATEPSGVEIVDIAYFVVGKVAAISQYPPLMRSELTLTAASEAEQTIDVNDVLLRVEGGEWVLRNARTGRRIVLRRTSAVVLAYDHATSVVRFLDALERSQSTRATLAWPEDRSVPFLPQLRWGSHVLAPAQWCLDEPTVDRLLAVPFDSRLEAVGRLRIEHRLPRHVLFLEAFDHWLHVDLECPLSIGAWLDIAKGPMLLREMFPAERSAVHGPEGHFVHEAVFPFLGSVPNARPELASSGAMPIQPSVDDAILPGGEWLYIEVLGSRQELLALACQLAKDVLCPLHRAGTVERWFYLPYADREPRLRVRSKGNAVVLVTEVFPALRAALEPAIAKGLVRDVSIRTYDRETYRYGGPVGMDLTEEVWTESSIETVARLDAIPDVFDMAEEDLVLELVRLHAWLLDHALGSPVEKRDVAAAAFRAYARTATPLDLRRAGSELHRKLRARLPAEASASPNDALSQVFARIQEGTRGGAISRPFAELLVDYLHTQTYRLVTLWHPNEKLEALAYVVLEKVYAGHAARKK